MKLVELLKNPDPLFRRNLYLYLLSYFFVLFNYPLIRASSTAFFFGSYGAKSSPVALFLSVFLLILCVYFCNRLQARYSVQKVFGLFSILSGGVFLLSLTDVSNEVKFFYYLPFIWKEIYIVIQVHLLLAYANNVYMKDEFRVLVGPIGAIGSIGGILGGWLTSSLSVGEGTLLVMGIGAIFIFIPALFFYFTPSLRKNITQVNSPLSSLTPEVKKYITYIAALVAITQFITNIADFNFNLAFEEAVSQTGERTSYLGKVYMLTNALAFFFQFLILPFLLIRVSEKNLHLFIPLSYLFFLIILFGLGNFHLVAIAAFYIYLKASDYSLFSAGKEILYQPLGQLQKYGAKYLTDMLVYRVSKALIAVVLIYLQSSLILYTMMVIFILIWMIIVIKIFKLHRKHFSQG